MTKHWVFLATSSGAKYNPDENPNENQTQCRRCPSNRDRMNMAPRQRKPRAPARQAAPRVVTIRDSEHLNLINSRLGSRLLILLYRTVSTAKDKADPVNNLFAGHMFLVFFVQASQSCKAMQGFFAEASRQQNLRHVVFGELDGADPATSVNSILLSKRLFSSPTK